MEVQADANASDMLMPSESYAEFVSRGDVSLSQIKTFSHAHGVCPYVVIGRLQKDRLIDYRTYASEKVRYEWAE